MQTGQPDAARALFGGAVALAVAAAAVSILGGWATSADPVHRTAFAIAGIAGGLSGICWIAFIVFFWREVGRNAALVPSSRRAWRIAGLFGPLPWLAYWATYYRFSI